MKNIFEYFKLDYEKEDHETVIDSITKGVVFKGTNLWVLVFAIFIASLGLNMNSPAVIIGAMLISPLMGPIMGIGLGAGVNDLALIKKALKNFLYATIVSLTTSTIFFFVTPLNDAYSEILARTTPNVYDVLIAFFGGLAGIVATSSKQKGNVIPGVAIATALMPPLCTAGFGIATLKPVYFFGALYLFIINTVFIALATFVTVRLLKFPYKHLPDERAESRSKKIIAVIVIITIAPSIYFAYDVVKSDRFTKRANQFIEAEAVFPGNYLLKKNIDAASNSIGLLYGGNEIKQGEVEKLKAKLKDYELDGTKLEVKQGFAYLNQDRKLTDTKLVDNALSEKQKLLDEYKLKADSVKEDSLKNVALIKETKALYPGLKSISVTPVFSAENFVKSDSVTAVYLQFDKIPSNGEKAKLQSWLETKLGKKVTLVMQR
jgi:uncharacterized hydrophobic protein (TIGR00271 family)